MISGHVFMGKVFSNLSYLSVSCKAIAQEAFIMRWHRISRYIKWFVQKFKIGHIVTYGCFILYCATIGLPSLLSEKKNVDHQNWLNRIQLRLNQILTSKNWWHIDYI